MPDQNGVTIFVSRVVRKPALPEDADTVFGQSPTCAAGHVYNVKFCPVLPTAPDGHFGNQNQRLHLMDREPLKAKYSAHPSNLIMLLHAIQKARPQQYISREDMHWVARYLNISLSTVYGVVRYYSMFSDVPRGRHIIRICQSPVCRMMGTDAVATSLETILDAPVGAVTADGHFSVEPAECLGHCDRAPVMMVDATVHGNLTHAKISTVIASLRPLSRK